MFHSIYFDFLLWFYKEPLTYTLMIQNIYNNSSASKLYWSCIFSGIRNICACLIFATFAQLWNSKLLQKFHQSII